MAIFRQTCELTSVLVGYMLPVVAPAFVIKANTAVGVGGLTCPARPVELTSRAQRKKASATKANCYSSQLLKNCGDSKHSERPELKSAKSLVADNQ